MPFYVFEFSFNFPIIFHILNHGLSESQHALMLRKYLSLLYAKLSELKLNKVHKILQNPALLACSVVTVIKTDKMEREGRGS